MTDITYVAPLPHVNFVGGTKNVGDGGWQYNQSGLTYNQTGYTYNGGPLAGTHVTYVAAKPSLTVGGAR